ncbi:MAG: hypothetical protein LBQ60_13285 [Bacteroidales bacterium]|jgi:cell division protein FtsQ|nr:hypothetical protein [Bacteroidales bacterium]
MKRLINIIFWVALLAYYFVAMSFVSLQRGEVICTSVNVTILDSLRSHFVTVHDVVQMIEQSAKKVKGKPLDSINTLKLEHQLVQHAPVQRAEVYKTIDGTLHVNIVQRKPVLRVINRFGESYYLDEEGQALKHSNRYSAHVLVANGYINQRAPGKETFNVWKMESEQGKRILIRELFELALWISDHSFWNAQIQQVYVNADGDFELIPRVGSHIIVFGRFDKADEKFSKLESLYRNGLNVKGWNTYDVINLKYDGQIVCTQR